jgi:hypothetical protein
MAQALLQSESRRQHGIVLRFDDEQAFDLLSGLKMKTLQAHKVETRNVNPRTL